MLPSVTMIKRDGPNFEGMASVEGIAVRWVATLQPGFVFQFQAVDDHDSDVLSGRADLARSLQVAIAQVVMRDVMRTGVGSPKMPVRKWPRRQSLKQRLQSLFVSVPCVRCGDLVLYRKAIDLNDGAPMGTPRAMAHARCVN